MTGKKSLGNTVLGWFVVREGEEEEPEPTPDELIEKYEKKPPPPPRQAVESAPAPPSVRLKGPVPQVAAGTTPDAKSFAQVYRAAEITDQEQERVEKALSLLQSLPTATPKDVRKQIVEASLKAFGIPIDQIIETGAQEIQALDAYIKQGEQHTQGILGDARARIEKLVAEIAEIKKLMELQVSTQQALTKASNEQKLRVQVVLEFFGQEAVARVVHDSPKLVELE